MYQLIHACQHGFLSGRSCVSQLVEVLDTTGLHLEIDRIFLDMSKTFDKVCHRKLIAKLTHYGLGGNLLRWFTSYLSNRKQRATGSWGSSESRSVTSGVPQGSILGPMLFLLLANGLPGVVKSSHVAAFADDTKIFKAIMSQNNVTELQQDLDKISNWADTTHMVFNSTKSKAMRITRMRNPTESTYTLCGSTLESTYGEKDLGVWISDNQTWSRQLSEACSKANKLLGFVRRNTRSIQSSRIKRCIYLALMLPHLGYATQVWAPQSKKLMRRVERVKCQATKFIFRSTF